MFCDFVFSATMSFPCLLVIRMRQKPKGHFLDFLNGSSIWLNLVTWNWAISDVRLLKNA